MKERTTVGGQSAELTPDKEEGPGEAQEGSFLTRWSQRKAAGGEHRRAPPSRSEEEPRSQAAEAGQEAAKEITDADLPPIESLDENSDYSLFFAPKISGELRRRALRKLFHAPMYQVRCPLNEYSEDYNSFTPLGDTVTYDMRRVLERAQDALNSTVQGQPQAQQTTAMAGAATSADDEGRTARAEEPADHAVAEAGVRQQDPDAMQGES